MCIGGVPPKNHINDLLKDMENKGLAKVQKWHNKFPNTEWLKMVKLIDETRILDIEDLISFVN